MHETSALSPVYDIDRRVSYPRTVGSYRVCNMADIDRVQMFVRTDSLNKSLIVHVVNEF